METKPNGVGTFPLLALRNQDAPNSHVKSDVRSEQVFLKSPSKVLEVHHSSETNQTADSCSVVCLNAEDKRWRW